LVNLAQGEFVVFSQLSGGWGPDGMALDIAGNLHVAQFGISQLHFGILAIASIGIGIFIVSAVPWFTLVLPNIFFPAR
jgi:hypothetical protein